MELYQKQLIKILSSAIKGKQFKSSHKDIIEWEKLINEAEEHDISALVYVSVDKRDFKDIDKKILNNWKTNVLKANITEIANLNYAKEILFGLQDKGIKAVSLKGLILKSFYGRPEFRTMCDIDLLINKNKFYLVEEYLNSIGYASKKSNSPIHSEFYKNNWPDIEVHWKLINDDFFAGNDDEFETHVWKNLKEINLYDMKLITLSDEDFLIHMLMHMVVHAKYEGFGLRQLYDLALFTRSKYKEIDWVRLEERINKYGITLFSTGIYELCDRLFDIRIPFKNRIGLKLKEDYIKLLLQNIIDSGVHGKKNKNIDFSCFYKPSGAYIKLKKIFEIIFIRKEELSERYSYAKNNTLLLPLAWFHRIFRAIFKKYGLKNLYKISKEAMIMGERRSKIVNIFKL